MLLSLKFDLNVGEGYEVIAVEMEITCQLYLLLG